MSVRWNELGPDGQGAAEAAFVALETSAAVSGRGTALLSPSALWAHVSGERTIARTELASALLETPALREVLAGLLERAALAIGPRVAAAATAAEASERTGDGFRLRVVPARGADGQVWITIKLDRPDRSPSRLTVLPPDGPPETVSLDPPLDGTIQLLVEAGSDLPRVIGEPASVVFLH